MKALLGLILTLLPLQAQLQLTNDVGFSKHDVLVPPMGIDLFRVFEGFDIGGTFHNFGSANQDSVIITASINGPSGTIYTHSFDTISITSLSSVNILPGETLAFPPFDSSFSPFEEGSYELIYTCNTPGDQNPSNDSLILSFYVDGPHPVLDLSNARVDNNKKVVHNSYPNQNATQSYQTCIVWQEPNTSSFYGTMYPYYTTKIGFVPHMDSSDLHLLPQSEIFLNLYEWNDSWSDLDDPSFSQQNGAFQSINLLSFGTYYPTSEEENDSLLFTLLQNSHYPVSNRRYLICAETYEPTTGIKFGFDTTVSYTKNYEVTKQPLAVVKIDTNWYVADPSWGIPSVVLQFSDFHWGLEESTQNDLTVFPNPSSGDVSLKTAESGHAEVQISTITGQVVSHQSVELSGTETVLETKNLPRGIYHLRLTFESGEISTCKFIKD